MPDVDPLLPLGEALKALSAWLRAGKVAGAVIGGVAASVLGRPRMTKDVDVLVRLEEPRWESFLREGERWGFVPRLSGAVEFARKSRVLLVRHRPSGVDLDLTLATLPIEDEFLARAKPAEIRGARILLPTPEDLIVMKAIAHRPRDAADIEAIRDAHPRLDLRRIRRLVRSVATALEQPELLDDLEALLKHRRGRTRNG